jgi:dipeptidyl aminopeptidase/acylaminoacyl peptidase
MGKRINKWDDNSFIRSKFVDIEGQTKSLNELFIKASLPMQQNFGSNPEETNMRNIHQCFVMVLILVALIGCQASVSAPPQATLQPESSPIEVGSEDATSYCCASWSPDSSMVAFSLSSRFFGNALMVAPANLSASKILVGDGTPFPFKTPTSEPEGNAADLPLKVVEKTRPVAVVEITGAPPPPEHPLGKFGEAAWSPQGDEIAFYFWPDESTQKRWGYTEGIYLIGPDGKNMRKLIDGFADSLHWSPDGQQLFFGKHDDEEKKFWICSIEHNGSGEQCFYEFSYQGFPLWGIVSLSPNGRQFAYIPETWDENHDIYILNSAGTGKLNITKDGSQESEVAMAWSPDGQRLVFAAVTPDYISHLYVINVDGTGSKLVGEGLDYDRVSWSPDGKWLMLTIREHPGNSLKRVEVDF